MPAFSLFVLLREDLDAFELRDISSNERTCRRLSIGPSWSFSLPSPSFWAKSILLVFPIVTDNSPKEARVVWLSRSRSSRLLAFFKADFSFLRRGPSPMAEVETDVPVPRGTSSSSGDPRAELVRTLRPIRWSLIPSYFMRASASPRTRRAMTTPSICRSSWKRFWESSSSPRWSIREREWKSSSRRLKYACWIWSVVAFGWIPNTST